MKYAIRLTVRKRGAIGSFYPEVFYLNAPDLEEAVRAGRSTHDDCRRLLFRLWQNQFSGEWEPNRLLGYSPSLENEAFPEPQNR